MSSSKAMRRYSSKSNFSDVLCSVRNAWRKIRNSSLVIGLHHCFQKAVFHSWLAADMSMSGGSLHLAWSLSESFTCAACLNWLRLRMRLAILAVCSSRLSALFWPPEVLAPFWAIVVRAALNLLQAPLEPSLTVLVSIPSLKKTTHFEGLSMRAYLSNFSWGLNANGCGFEFWTWASGSTSTSDFDWITRARNGVCWLTFADAGGSCSLSPTWIVHVRLSSLRTIEVWERRA